MDWNNLFDVIIALIIAVVPLYLVELRYRWATTSARGPRVFAAAALALFWIVVVYGSFIEPRFLTVREHEMTIGDLGVPLKLVVVSDLHLGRYRHRDWTAKVVDQVNALQPDVVVLLGDLVDGPKGADELAPLAGLKTRFGAYAVLGNTDYRIGAVEIRHAVESQGVEVLTNEWVRLGENGPVLAGLDDLWFGQPDWERALAGIPPEAPVIMAVHNPDEANRAEYYGVDLMISGHTHGGQIRLPLVGPVAPMPTTLGRHFDRGLFPYGQMLMFITSGAGESGVRARLFNPAEVVRLDLTY